MYRAIGNPEPGDATDISDGLRGPIGAHARGGEVN